MPTCARNHTHHFSCFENLTNTKYVYWYDIWKLFDEGLRFLINDCWYMKAFWRDSNPRQMIVAAFDELWKVDLLFRYLESSLYMERYWMRYMSKRCIFIDFVWQGLRYIDMKKTKKVGVKRAYHSCVIYNKRVFVCIY